MSHPMPYATHEQAKARLAALAADDRKHEALLAAGRPAHWSATPSLRAELAAWEASLPLVPRILARAWAAILAAFLGADECGRLSLDPRAWIAAGGRPIDVAARIAPYLPADDRTGHERRSTPPATADDRRQADRSRTARLLAQLPPCPADCSCRGQRRTD